MITTYQFFSKDNPTTDHSFSKDKYANINLNNNYKCPIFNSVQPSITPNNNKSLATNMPDYDKDESCIFCSKCRSKIIRLYRKQHFHRRLQKRRVCIGLSKTIVQLWKFQQQSKQNNKRD